MKVWWWRIGLLVLGIVIVSCSLCLVAYSNLGIRRDVDRDIVPIESPPVEPTPESYLPGGYLLLGAYEPTMEKCGLRTCNLCKRIVLAQIAKVRLGTSPRVARHSFSGLVRRGLLCPQIQTHPWPGWEAV